MTTTPSDSGLSSLKTVEPEEYIRADAELLRSGQPAMQVAILAGRALSVGVSQRDDAECIVRARRIGIPVVRRSTGGLGILHAPGDIAWSLILPRSDPQVGRDFSTAYGRLGEGLVRFLGELGVSSAWQLPIELPSEYCLLSGRGAVLTVAGRAIGGAAQHLTRLALLHHGVLPYHLDPSLLHEVFDLEPGLVRRSLTSLEQVVGDVPPLELAHRLQSVLSADTSPGSA